MKPVLFCVILLSSLVGKAFADTLYSGDLIQVLTRSQIVIPGEQFVGDVDINSSGRAIACSRKGFFVGDPNGQNWTEVLDSNGDSPVDPTTPDVLCRINENNFWVLVNKKGVYRGDFDNDNIAELVTPSVSGVGLYGLDLNKFTNKWISLSDALGWTGDDTSNSIVLFSGNRSINSRKILKINSFGSWVSMTDDGIWKDDSELLDDSIFNSQDTRHPEYWSLDFNNDGDWVAITNKTTYVNGTQILTDVDDNGPIQASGAGQMIVQITDRGPGAAGSFIWMAVTPNGVFRDADKIDGIIFSANDDHYALSINNGGDYIFGSNDAFYYNSNFLIEKAGSAFINDAPSGVSSFNCDLNDLGDYVCLTNRGVFRNHSRGDYLAYEAMDGNDYNVDSESNKFRIGANGAIIGYIEGVGSDGGIYWGMNHVEAAPPLPTNVTLTGETLTWADGGGNTTSFKVTLNSEAPTDCPKGIVLYTGTATSFMIDDFSGFSRDALQHLSVSSVNTSGVSSAPVSLAYNLDAYPFEVLVEEAPSPVRLTWLALPGKTYTVYHSETLDSDLSVASFSLVPGTTPATYQQSVVFSSGPELVSADLLPTGPSGFYRITESD